MQTEQKCPAHVEKLKKLRRELLQRIVQNEARRRADRVAVPKEVRKG